MVIMLPSRSVTSHVEGPVLPVNTAVTVFCEGSSTQIDMVEPPLSKAIVPPSTSHTKPQFISLIIVIGLDKSKHPIISDTFLPAENPASIPPELKCHN